MEMYFTALLIIFFYMLCGFVAAYFIKRNDIVDPMWGGGFVLVALGTYLQGSQQGVSTLATFLVIVWGVRLTTRLSKRFSAKREEDFRYKNWRDAWMKKGERYFLIRSFYKFLPSKD